MNEKCLNTLEFNKIKAEVKKYAITKTAQDMIDDLKPYLNLYKVEKALNETREAFNILIKKSNPPFGGMHDISFEVERASKGAMLTPAQLLKIAGMLKCARRFKGFMNHKEDEESYEIIEDLCEGIVLIKNIEDDIFQAIMGEEEISDRASTTLYNIRRSLRDKNASIKDKVNSLMRTYSKYLQENIYTVRGDRYVLPVRSEYKALVPGLVHDQSASGATLFIEPMGLVNLNNEIKELYLKEKAEIERILMELSSNVYNEIIPIRNNANILYKVDFIFAKAKYGSKINGTCPMVNDKGNVYIIEGKHPLINPKEVVANTIYLGKDFTSLVITGPNTGGKTVTLKTVGLLEIMGLSGLLIPARENSVISFFDEIFADIGDEQSIEQSLSTFSSHMKNIVKIMENADENSLVLFDELGAGTDPTEGAALAIAILEELKNRGSKIIATTHYSELKAYALRSNGVENASVEFDVETLRPTYKLLIGIPGKSNAFEISKRLGLQDYIIDDAKNRITSNSLQFEDLIQSLQNKSIQAEKNFRESEKLKIQFEDLKRKYEIELNNLNNKKEKLRYKAERDAKDVIRNAKEEADEILKNIRELERKGYSSKVRQELEIERKKLKDRLNKEEKSFNIDLGEKLKNVEEGQEVFIPKLNQKAIVLSKPDNKGEVLVQAGILKINVKFEELRKSNGNVEDKNERRRKKREAKLKLNSVSTSLDLRGMDSIEATFSTDKYLDDAYVAGLNEVTIIHGKGTGVLRNTIQDMLKKHRHVKNFRLGEYGEGGTGVTIVQLK